MKIQIIKIFRLIDSSLPETSRTSEARHAAASPRRKPAGTSSHKPGTPAACKCRADNGADDTRRQERLPMTMKTTVCGAEFICDTSSGPRWRSARGCGGGGAARPTTRCYLSSQRKDLTNTVFWTPALSIHHKHFFLEIKKLNDTWMTAT